MKWYSANAGTQMHDDTCICVRCNKEVERDQAELVGLVLYCSGCAMELREDAEIDAMLKASGGCDD